MSLPVPQPPFLKSLKSNRPVRELVAEAKAEVMEVMEEMDDAHEDADEEEPADISAVSTSL